MFPPDYPFAPPAIRMHTPSGRFQPSTRLCLSISDFHPRSFNPAWEVSTILIGLLSFMTSEEMTTGSVSATPAERKFHAARSRWWNSTGGGTYTGGADGNGSGNSKAKVQVKAGDGGVKFRTEWPDQDKANWAWMKEQHVDVATGQITAPPPPPAAQPAAASSSSSSSLTSTGNSSKSIPGGGSQGASCGKQLGVPAAGAGGAGAGTAGNSGTQAQAVVDAVRQGRGAGQGWLARNKLYVFGGLVFLYVLVARLVGGDKR